MWERGGCYLGIRFQCVYLLGADKIKNEKKGDLER